LNTSGLDFFFFSFFFFFHLSHLHSLMSPYLAPITSLAPGDQSFVGVIGVNLYVDESTLVWFNHCQTEASLH
jgi:hypothetical protein